MSAEARAEVVQTILAAADQWGIPRLLLLACGIAESNLIPNARRPARQTDDERMWPDVSGGIWQQTVRYDPEYAGGGVYPGPSEVERVLQKQYDVTRSAHVAAQNLKQKLGLECGDPLTDATDDQMLRAMYRYNWPAGGGRPFSPAHEQNYLRGLAEAKKILPELDEEPMPTTTLPYNPDAPVDRQPVDWTCSIESAQWLLRSIGRNPDASDPTNDPWLRSQLVPGIVRPDLGLLDGTGAQLAAWITREYGSEMGFTAHAVPVSFDDVAAGAGVNPTIMGGGNYYHWVGVRRLNTDGTLALANPAPGYKGVGDSMSRAQFDALGPFHAVFIDRGAVAPGQPSPPPAESRLTVLVREIRERLDELEKLAS